MSTNYVMDVLQERRALPIFLCREELLKTIKIHQILVIVGDTGCGKTTQIPQYLHEAGYSKLGKIVCTQPWRAGAMSIAARVATEMGVELGSEVGYSTQFGDCTSHTTVVKYMTDGILLRDFLGEQNLASYSVIMLDDVHQRSLSTNLLFGLIKDFSRCRPDMKFLISSTTRDAQKLSDYFGASIFCIPAQRHPVHIMHCNSEIPRAECLVSIVTMVLAVHKTQPPGDVLVFLTGQHEIETAEESLKRRRLKRTRQSLGSEHMDMIIRPIYANLSPDMEAKILGEETPKGARKVVLATNIAETSLTLAGVRYVIDPGYCKQKIYSHQTDMESLIVTRISRAAAEQRAGRAGRTSAGICYRLYTERSFKNDMAENTVPEIQRTKLGNMVLLLKCIGINNLIKFDYLDPPRGETLSRALEQLYALGALNHRGELTKTGRRMAEFPMDPVLSKMLVASDKYKCSEEVVTICAMLSTGNSIFYRPKYQQMQADIARMKFHAENFGDHIALLKVYDSWKETNYSTSWCFENYIQIRSMKRARDIRDQLKGLMERVEIKSSSNPRRDKIRKGITSGIFYHTAKLQKDGSYRTLKNPQTVSIHPNSGYAQPNLGLPQVLPRWVVYHDIVMTGNDKYMRQVTEIQPQWLLEIAPHCYEDKDVEDFASYRMPKGVGRAGPD